MPNPQNSMLAATSAIATSTCRVPAFKFSLPPLLSLSTKPHLDSSSGNLLMTSVSPRETVLEDDGFISMQEWQGWGSLSPLPSLVMRIVQDLKSLEANTDAHMTFGGKGGKLQVFILLLEL